MKTILYADEIAREFGGMTLIVRPELDPDDEKTVTGYEYCVTWGDGKETNWIDSRADTEDAAFGEAQDWAIEIASCEIEEALEDDSSEPYAWMIENIDDFVDYTDALVEDLVKQQAQVSYDFGSSVPDWVRETLSFEQFLEASDYKYALKAVREYRDERRAEQQLAEVVTPSEVSDELGIKEDTVRDACQNGWITARKSGKTWLIRRRDAEKRWKK